MKTLLVSLGVFFVALAVPLMVGVFELWFPEVFHLADIPGGDCGCDSGATSYDLLYTFMRGRAIIVPIVMFLLSFLCFLKAFRGRCG